MAPSKKRRLYKLENNGEALKENDTDQERLLQARGMIRKAALASVPNAFIPIPLINLGALAFVQARLIQRIGTLYEQPHSLKHIREVITILLTCYVTEFFSNNTFMQGLRMLPGIPSFLGLGFSSTFYYGSTKIIGELFLQHFEAGGTVLSFDPQQVKTYYNRMLQQTLHANSGQDS